MFYCKSCNRFKQRYTLAQCEDCFKKDREVLHEQEKKRREQNLTAIYFGCKGLELVEGASLDGIQVNPKRIARRANKR